MTSTPATEGAPFTPEWTPGKRDVSLSMEKVNRMALPVALVPLFLVGTAFLLLWGFPRFLVGARHLLRWYIFLPALLGGIVAHEGIHGVSWAVLGRKPLASIRFGMHWKTLTPFAHCSQPMKASVYRWGAMMPAIILGGVPTFYGLAIGDGGWALYGLLFLIAATGDLLVLWAIRDVGGDALVEDHPTRAGCFVYDSGAPGGGNERQ
jgi:hypothetical protein